MRESCDKLYLPLHSVGILGNWAVDIVSKSQDFSQKFTTEFGVSASQGVMKFQEFFTC